MRKSIVLMMSVALTSSAVTIAPAQAGTNHHWTKLTTSRGISSGTEGRLVRYHGKLEVFWTQRDTPGSSLRVVGVSAAGKVDATSHVVVQSWADLINEPSPIVEHGQLVLAFGGIRATTPYEKYSGAMAYATSTDAKSWTLGDEALSEHRDYVDYGTAAVDDHGVPFVAFAPTSVSQVSLHRDIGPGFPSAAPDTYSTPNRGDVSAINLARDSMTGAIWAAWYSLGGGDSDVFYQQVSPTRGPLLTAPGGSQPYQQVAMASPSSGGVYIAYAVGSPSPTKVRVLNTGNGKSRDIGATGPGSVTLAPGPGGRLWVSWRQNSTETVAVVRTNAAISRFGKVVTIPSPTTSSIGHIAADGPTGALDLVVSAAVPGKSYSALFHTQVLAPLTVTLVKKGLTVVATVTDAGTPVAGAKVSLAGKVFHTGSSGRVALPVPAKATGRQKVVASKALYAPATTTFVVG